MLVDSEGLHFISLRPKKRGKRRGSLYFSTKKVLTRSRMTRGARAPPRNAEPIQEDLWRVLRYERDSTVGEEYALQETSEAAQEAIADNQSSHHARRAADVSTVR